MSDLKHRVDVLTDALRTAREMIRGQQIEHALVDLGQPDLGLGAYLDWVLAGSDAANERKEGK